MSTRPAMHLSLLPGAASAEGGGDACWYRVAQHRLGTNLPLAELAPFQVEGPSLPAPVRPPEEPPQAERVYRGPGWIGNQWRAVEGRCSPAGYWIVVAGAGRFWVSADGSALAQTDLDAAAGRESVAQAAIGPLLILALALHGVWCLHASAVVAAGQLVAFAGESGNGKSTLAAYLGGAGAGWQRAGDDILPVAPSPEGVDGLPHYPQLKLPAPAQPAVGLPERLPLAAVYWLRDPAAGQAGVEIGPLSRREAVLALVRHTVAARLFGADLLARHLAFCRQAAAAVPVRTLAYARRHELLPQVRDALIADLDARQDQVRCGGSGRLNGQGM